MQFVMCEDFAIFVCLHQTEKITFQRGREREGEEGPHCEDGFIACNEERDSD